MILGAVGQLTGVLSAMSESESDPPPNRVSAIPLGPDPECPLLVGSALSAGCLEHQLSGAPGKQQSEAETVTRNHWGE